MDKIQTLAELLGMLRRRFLLWASVICVGVLISLYYVLQLPQQFETSATIQIEQPPIQTSDTSAGALNAAMLQKLQIIEQRVMARDNLLAIIDKFALYADAPGLSDTQKVGLLREASRVRHITNPDFRWRQDISPSALLVTVRMNDPVLAANVANELVNNVLEQDEMRSSARVRETLNFFESEERRILNSIAILEDEIAEFKQENAELLPGGVEILRTRVADLQQIELELQREIVSIQDGRGSNNTSVRAQQVRRLQEERELYRLEIAEIRQAIADSPRVEQQYNRLQRQLQKLEDQFAAITVGKAEAEMNHMLETSSQVDSFAVLEKALPPDWPIAPSRKRVLGMGGLMSAVVALTLVFLAELRSPVIWTRSQFERQLGMRAVVAIPVIEQKRERKSRLVRSGFSLAALAAGFTALVGVIFKFAR